MTERTKLSMEQIRTLREQFQAGKQVFVVAISDCSSRLTPGKAYPIIDVDGRYLVLREDDGDRQRIGPDCNWNKYFSVPMTAEETAAFEAAQAAKEKRRAYLVTQTTDELVAFIHAQRDDLSMATDIVRQRMKGII